MGGFVLLTLLVSSIVYISVSRYLENDFNQLLELRAESIASLNIDQKETSRTNELSEKLFHERDFFFSLDVDLPTISDSSGVDIDFLKTVVQQNKAYYSDNGIKYIGVIEKSQLNNEKYIVITGAENYMEKNIALFLFQILLYTFLISIIFGLLFSFVLSKYLFQPIVKLTERAKQISSKIFIYVFLLNS